jgi:hypothetical protein
MFLREPCALPNFSLLQSALVYAVGGAQLMELPFQIDRYDSAYQVDLVVNAPGKEIAPLLAGYGATVWNLSWTEGTEIIAVAAVAENRHAFAGLPVTVPSISGHFGSGFDCKRIPSGYAVMNPSVRNQFDAASRQIYGRPVDAVFGGSQRPIFLKAPKAIVAGEPLVAGVRLVKAPHPKPESFRLNR